MVPVAASTAAINARHRAAPASTLTSAAANDQAEGADTAASRPNTRWKRMRHMTDRTGWAQIKDRRMAEDGAREAYGAARLAYELGRTVRQLREQRDWSQPALADSAGMTQSAVARFEAGDTVPSLPVLDRLARALDADLVVHLTPRAHVA